jgi:four helix bundle protein
MSGKYQDLKVWQLSMDVAEDVYDLTRTFPNDELYGMRSQMRRSAVSIPSNIAEGKGRNSNKELLHFLSNARGSLHELETQLLLAMRFAYVSAERAEEMQSKIAEVARMLSGLMSFAANASP